MEKVYSVEFMRYTNACEDTVSDQRDDFISDIQYLHVGYAPFLVKESELDKYSKFGGGFRSITFVGNIQSEPMEGASKKWE